ncbi:MAG: hypothetical protein EOO73_35290 [Myxococcales bacterium]|nr:MAG: hypothetical protein EOO73_35290 [Myxococcales bacterium]
MPAPIVVEVYAPQPSVQELSVLIAACRRAAAPNECASSDAKTTEPPLGVAIVRREGDRAHIELGLRGVASAEWSTRDLVFQPGDDELERYRAIGFAVGTLVARQTEPPAAEAPEPPSEPPSVPPTPIKPELAAPEAAPAAPARPLRSTWVDVAGQVGLGLIPGPPRVGAAFRAASELAPRGLFAVAELGYAERPGEPTLRARWLHLSLGVGHPLSQLRSLGVDVRLALALERLAVTAVDGGRSQGEARWKPGAVAAVDGRWDFAPPVGLLLSAATFIDPERTFIRSGGQPAGETPALGLSGYVGFRLRLR